MDPTDGENLALPDDPELLSDLTSLKFKVTTSGIQVSSKDEIAEDIGRSPDKGDSIMYAHANPTLPGQGLFDWYSEQYEELERKRREEEAALERMRKGNAVKQRRTT